MARCLAVDVAPRDHRFGLRTPAVTPPPPPGFATGVALAVTARPYSVTGFASHPWRRGRGAAPGQMPPFTAITWPVMAVLAADARKTMGEATSAAVSRRRIGVRDA